MRGDQISFVAEFPRAGWPRRLASPGLVIILSGAPAHWLWRKLRSAGLSGIHEGQR